MEERENLVVVNIEHKQLKIHSLRFDKTQLMINDEYELKQEGDKWFVVKKKKGYPRTYEECAMVLLDRASSRNDIGYKGDLLVSLQKLLVCRDAYWTLYGEEMGLGEPWEPTKGDSVFSISRMHGKIGSACHLGECCIFEFPTKEMRDAFKENFDPDIDNCKEFL